MRFSFATISGVSTIEAPRFANACSRSGTVYTAQRNVRLLVAAERTCSKTWKLRLLRRAAPVSSNLNATEDRTRTAALLQTTAAKMTNVAASTTPKHVDLRCRTEPTTLKSIA